MSNEKENSEFKDDLGKDGNNNEDWGEKGFDPTKEAFFSDLVEMEDEIAEEAIELVEHAISLLNSKFYDDAIEILRQAIGLYDQIDSTEEIKAIQEKISEIYLLKEKQFAEETPEISQAEPEIIQEGEEIKQEITKEIDGPTKGDYLIIEGKDLEDIEEFEKALLCFEEALVFFQDTDNREKIQEIEDNIELCRARLPTTGEIEEVEQIEDKIQEQKDTEVILNNALELKARGTELFQSAFYEESREAYQKAIDLFEKINKSKEIEQIQDNISEIGQILEEKEAERVRKLKESEEKKAKHQEDLRKLEEKAKIEELKKKEEKLEKLQDFETKKREEEAFQIEIDNMVSQAKKIMREYELKIRKGDFSQESPYEEIIDIYTNIRKRLFGRGWKEQAQIYTNEIKLCQEKLEKDKKLREIEEKKKEKERMYQEAMKTPSMRDRGGDVDKMQKIVQDSQKEAGADIESEISRLVNEAEKKTRKYELKMRKGDFSQECPYEEIIDIYTDIRKRLFEQGWKEQAQIYTNQIRIYKDKLAKDQKLREIERKKKEKDRLYEEAMKAPSKKIPSEVSEPSSSMKTKNQEEEKSQQALNLLDKAEKLIKNYELRLKKNVLLYESPYEEAIDLYESARQLFKEIGWTNEAAKLMHSIKLYEDKKEKDLKLREIESQKKKEEEKATTIKKEKEVPVMLREEKIQKLQKEKEEQSVEANRIFERINQVEKLAKEYERKIKGGDILSVDSPYENIISIYREAKNEFQKIDWKEEATRLNSSIQFYKQKLEKDKKLREFERKKVEKNKQYEQAMKTTIKKPSQSVGEVMKAEKGKDKEEEISNEAFRIIDEAEKKAKQYELNIKAGYFPDCPYEEIIQTYRKAKDLLSEIGWDAQASQLSATIQFYKKKLDADNKLRKLEGEKKKKREIEEKQRKIYIKKLKEKESALQTYKPEKKESEEEQKRDRAFSLMDKAKIEFNKKNYDEASEFYRESMEIFEEIDWKEGIRMVKESLALIRKRKKEFEERLQSMHEKQAKRRALEQKLEEKLEKVKTSKKIEQIGEEKRIEQQKSEKAYQFLEEGTNLMNKKHFERAYEKYINARDLFKEIGWKQEISRINNDILFTLKREQKRYDGLQSLRKKVMREQKEKDVMYQKSLIHHDEARKKAEEAKKKKAKQKRANKLEQIAYDEVEAGKELLELGRYNQALLKLREAKDAMQKAKISEEINKIDEMVENVKEKSQLPIIIDEGLKKEDDEEKFRSAYMSIDKAQSSINDDNLMRAISEMNEAKFNLKDLSFGTKYIQEINSVSDEIKTNLREKRKGKKASSKEKKNEKEEKEINADTAWEYMDKCKKYERRNNFVKAVEFAEKSREIFEQLGEEWSRAKSSVVNYISKLKKKQDTREKIFRRAKEEKEREDQDQKEVEDAIQERIQQRREERRRRIKELMEKKSQNADK